MRGGKAFSERFSNGSSGSPLTRQPRIGRNPLSSSAPNMHLNPLSSSSVNNNLSTGERNQLLISYARERNLQEVLQLLEKGADVNDSDRHGHTALFEASKNGDCDLVQALLERGANINQADKTGCTPLHIAAQLGRLEVVRKLIDSQADICVKDDSGSSPLHKAIICKGTSEAVDEVIKELVRNGCSVREKDNEGQTPLHFACEYGKIRAARDFLESGADANAQNSSGRTPLHYACRLDSVELVLLLVSEPYCAKIGSIDNRGSTPLHEASFFGNIEVTRCLLAFLEDEAPLLNVQDKRGRTPLHLACYNAELEMVKDFLEKKADVSIVDKDGKTPLHWASSRPSRLDIVEILLEYGADMEVKDKEGLMPLDLAKRIDNTDVALYLKMSRDRFFQPLHAIRFSLKNAEETELVSIVPLLETSLNYMCDFLQLKFLFTAVNTYYRLEIITADDRKQLIQRALNKAKKWCTSAFHTAMFRVAVSYAAKENLISEFDKYVLEQQATEKQIENSDFIKAMQVMLERNTERLEEIEENIVAFQKEVAGAIVELNTKIVQVKEKVDDTAEAFNQFARNYRFSRNVEFGCDIMGALLNIVSLGVAGGVLKGALGLTLGHIADFSELTLLRDAVESVGMSEALGSVSIKDSFENGLKLAECLATRKLDSALSEENEITLLACTLAIFQNNLPVMKIDRSAGASVPELDDSCNRRSMQQIDPPDFDSVPVKRQAIKSRDPSTGVGDIIPANHQSREPQSDPEPSNSIAGSNDDDDFDEGRICRPSTFVPPTPGKVKTSDDPFFLDNLDGLDLYNPNLGIFVAIINGNMEDLEYELKQSTDLDLTNFFDSRGRNPIEFAAIMGNLDIVHMLEGCGCRFVSVSRPFLLGLARKRAAQS